ncbi:neuronal acetylcholine receptor subunit beta-3-like [Ylistrum balloti]|uniref:neuronal acetylcholine receptor subunit beta-3-like n=1 Tax=Ylistrum balloti TaxID=509963 RepID=UPI002905C4FE|nr:neuronal acetylcholine receptor subunit beta-3-like [Ylistrum balloti]
MTKTSTFIFLVTYIYVISTLAHSQGTRYDLMRLRDTLFQNYTKDFRPVYNLSDSINVSLEMFLISIIDLDEVTGTITLNCAISMVWTDDQLVWNQSDFAGITSFVFNSSYVWKPRVYISTSSDDLTDFSFDAFDVRVYSNGTITSTPGRHVRSSCLFDMTKFPSDSQLCTLQVIPWTHPASEMTFIIANPEINLAYYKSNGEWDIDWTSVTNNTDSGTLYSVIDFSIHLTRRSAYFLVSMTTPVLLLCYLNPFVFLLPAPSGERISYTITIFLSLAVYMTIIGDNMPQISEPMAGISYFLLVAMLYSSLLILLTIFTLRCDYVIDKHEFPDWVLWLASKQGPRKRLDNKVNIAKEINIVHVKEHHDSKDDTITVGEHEKENGNNKSDVMIVIDRLLFWITLSMMVVISLVFSIYFWV